MAAHKSVSDANLPLMLARFWELRQQGLSYEDIVPHVSKFWENGLSSAGALAQYIRSCKTRSTTPQWFRDWMWNEDPDARPPAQVRIADSLLPPKEPLTDKAIFELMDSKPETSSDGLSGFVKEIRAEEPKFETRRLESFEKRLRRSAIHALDMVFSFFRH